MVSIASYQIPNNFHHANPTVDQISTFETDTTAPTRNQSFIDTYSCAKNIGDGVVP